MKEAKVVVKNTAGLELISYAFLPYLSIVAQRQSIV